MDYTPRSLHDIAAELRAAGLPPAPPAPVITVQWENGVRVSPIFTVATKAEAFATLDRWLALAEHPASLHMVIAEDGVPVWEQHGTHITLNR